jgi:hypothetical protein
MAGVRLAGLLNQALGDQAAERSLRAELLSRIDAISRKLTALAGGGRSARAIGVGAAGWASAGPRRVDHARAAERW